MALCSTQDRDRGNGFVAAARPFEGAFRRPARNSRTRAARSVAWLVPHTISVALATLILALGLLPAVQQADAAVGPRAGASHTKRCPHGKKRVHHRCVRKHRPSKPRPSAQTTPATSPTTGAAGTPSPSETSGAAPAAAPGYQAVTDGSAVSGGPAGPIVTTNADGTVCATGNTALAFYYSNGWEWFRHYSTCGFWLDEAWDGPYWEASDYAYWGDQTFMAQWPGRGY